MVNEVAPSPQVLLKIVLSIFIVGKQKFMSRDILNCYTLQKNPTFLDANFFLAYLKYKCAFFFQSS